MNISQWNWRRNSLEQSCRTPSIPKLCWREICVSLTSVKKTLYIAGIKNLKMNCFHSVDLQCVDSTYWAIRLTMLADSRISLANRTNDCSIWPYVNTMSAFQQYASAATVGDFECVRIHPWMFFYAFSNFLLKQLFALITRELFFGGMHNPMIY